jgi:hypothetical protein
MTKKYQLEAVTTATAGRKFQKYKLAQNYAIYLVCGRHLL